MFAHESFRQGIAILRGLLRLVMGAVSQCLVLLLGFEERGDICYWISAIFLTGSR